MGSSELGGHSLHSSDHLTHVIITVETIQTQAVAVVVKQVHPVCMYVCVCVCVYVCIYVQYE